MIENRRRPSWIEYKAISSGYDVVGLGAGPAGPVASVGAGGVGLG